MTHRSGFGVACLGKWGGALLLVSVCVGACRDSDVNAPPATYPVCSGSGNLGLSEDRPCPEPNSLPAIATPAIDHYSSAYSGSLPKCPEFDPSGRGFSVRFTVEKVRFKTTEIADSPGSMTGRGVSESFIDGKVDEAGQAPCGHMLSIGFYYSDTGGEKGVRVGLSPGDTVIVSQRVMQFAHNDVLGVHVITHEDGTILLAFVDGVRPETFPDDLIPGIDLVVPKENICKTGRWAWARFAFRTGQDSECWLDSRTQRCCTLWGQTYEVRSDSATVRLEPEPDAPIGPWAKVGVYIGLDGFATAAAAPSDEN